MRWIWLVIGALLLIAGVIWTLQGVGVIGGSFMSGSLTWAIIGPIVALVGLALVAVSLRRRGAPTGVGDGPRGTPIDRPRRASRE